MLWASPVFKKIRRVVDPAGACLVRVEEWMSHSAQVSTAPVSLKLPPKRSCYPTLRSLKAALPPSAVSSDAYSLRGS